MIVSEYPPRPLLSPLTGGYRKIPVMQIGSDVFCDTRTIAAELASRTNHPELALENSPVEVRQLVAEAEFEAFFACMQAAGSLEMVKKAMKSLSIWQLGRFALDRMNMAMTASKNLGNPINAGSVLKKHLHRLEAQLKHDFLFGHAPNVADFAVYPGLWMIHEVARKNTISRYPKLSAWMERMQGLGEGDSAELNAAEALKLARESEPADIPAEHQAHSLIGKKVQIAPSDYAQDPSSGILVGASSLEWIIAHQNEQVGTIHIHFPKDGYDLTEMD